MVNIKMATDDIHDLKPRIAVVGVGGAGGNAVNNMISANLEGCEFIVCNTDSQALKNSSCDQTVQLGAQVTGGLGAGSKPEIGKAAAEESLDEVMKYIDGANMVFVTAGMGGGTGTGAAPVIARACREKGVLTVGVVTKPFHFEGSHRMKMAETGLEEMQDVVDTLIVIPNQNLFRIANEKTTFAEAFQMADSVLQAGVRGVTDLMVRPGLVNLDFADIRTAMLEMGKAMMGTGEAEGEKRAIEAAESAINNPLLDDVSMKGAHGVIINVTGGYDMTLFEADEACNRIRDEVDPNANIIFGATFDENLEGKMRVSIVATGIEREADHGRRPGSISGSTSGGGGQNKAFERAVPRTDNTAGMSPVSGGQGGVPKAPQGGNPYSSSSSSDGQAFSALRSAPSSQPQGALAAQGGGYAASMHAGAPASSSVPAPEKQPDPQDKMEADMFDQSRLGDGHEDEAGLPQNTALRGTRYKNAFIPPKPAQADQYGEQPGSQPLNLQMKTQSYTPPQQVSEQPVGTSLKLNPPRLPTKEEPKRTPSLLERITGSVQQTLGGAMGYHHEDDHQQHGSSVKRAPSFHDMQRQDKSSQATQSSPAQGRLNIDSPSGPARQSDDDLDIPAFLRRQAN